MDRHGMPDGTCEAQAMEGGARDCQGARRGVRTGAMGSATGDSGATQTTGTGGSTGRGGAGAQARPAQAGQA